MARQSEHPNFVASKIFAAKIKAGIPIAGLPKSNPKSNPRANPRPAPAPRPTIMDRKPAPRPSAPTIVKTMQSQRKDFGSKSIVAQGQKGNQQAAARREAAKPKPSFTHVKAAGISIPLPTARNVAQKAGLAGMTEVALTVKGLGKMATGFGPGMVATVRHPERTAKAVAKDYKRRYGPLVHGDVKTFAATLAKEPAPYLLDVMGGASAGAKGAAKAGLVKVPERRAIRAGTAKAQPIRSPNTLTAMAQHKFDQFSTKHPNVPVIGAKERVARINVHADDLEQGRGALDAHFKHGVPLPEPTHPPKTRAGKALDTMRDAASLGFITGNPAYIPRQIPGNLGMLMMQSPKALRHLPKGLPKMASKEISTRIQHEMGDTPAQSLHSTGKNVVSRTARKVATAQGKLADVPYRSAAWRYEANKAGYKTEQAKLDLLTKPSLRPRPNQVSGVARKSMVDFTMGKGERSLSRVAFVYPWIRGATKLGAGYPLHRPGKSIALGQIGSEGQRRYGKELSKLPDYMQSYIPIGGPHKEGGKLVQKLMNPAQISPISTALEAGSALARAGKGVVDGNPKDLLRLGAHLQPGIQVPIEAATRYSPFFGSSDYLRQKYSGHGLKQIAKIAVGEGLGQMAAPKLAQAWMGHETSKSKTPMGLTGKVGQTVGGSLNPRGYYLDKLYQQKAMSTDDPVQKQSHDTAHYLDTFKHKTQQAVPPEIANFAKALTVRNEERARVFQETGGSGFMRKNETAIGDLRAAVRLGLFSKKQADAFIPELKKRSKDDPWVNKISYELKVQLDAQTGYKVLKGFKAIGAYPPDLYRGHQ